ncbi:MAG: cupin domain-containing protein [Solirubrobacteraceae bacterium]
MTTYRLTPSESVTVVSDHPDALEVEAVYGPGGTPPPAHLHPAQDERFEVLEGALTIRVDGAQRVLAAGETIEVPRGVPHQMWNAAATPARVAWRTSPAGRTGTWYATLDRLQREGRVGKDGMPGPLAFAVYLTEFRDVFRLHAGPLTPVVSAALRALAPVGRLRGYRP